MEEMKNTLGLLFLFFVIQITFKVEAKVKLPSVISNNMVLQQQSEVNLWGKTESHKKVKITTSWNKKTYIVNSDTNGDWQATVVTPTAGGPYEILFDDGETLKLGNVLIGEVWFCSGQSNMEMPIRGFDCQPVDQSNDIIAKAKPKTPIRMYTTDSKDGRWVRQYAKTPQFNCQGEWLENTSQNVANISAVAYYFAKYLEEVLEVPIGIIISSWGGSRVEAWMSKEAISPFKNIDLSFLTNNEEVKNPTAAPCVLYNAKINPLTKFGIKGFLWYQGESNRDNAKQYKELMPAFVKDLRSKWENENLPFYFVQIAPFNYEGADGVSAAYLREAQEQNMKDIPKSGMVTTMDIGHPVFIHPIEKEKVGNRLAYWALADTYGLQGFGYKPPMYKSMEKVGNKIYINFDYAENGLFPMWTSLSGFEIAGEDRVFHPAFAEIETSTARLAVSSRNVPNPVAVRYAYKNFIEASIFSIYGIPVSPFRTDNW